jgi:hypothetical protein
LLSLSQPGRTQIAPLSPKPITPPTSSQV